MKRMFALATLVCTSLMGCGAEDSDGDSTADPTSTVSAAATDLQDLAFVVSEASDGIFVLNTKSLEHVADIDTNVHTDEMNSNHMAIVSPDGQKVYVMATHANAVVVIDANSLKVVKTIEVGLYSTHGAFREGSNELWVVNEDDNTVTVIDSNVDEVTHVISHPTFVVPHNVQFDHQNELAYIPSIGGNQISVVDGSTYEVVDYLVTDGSVVGPCTADPCGFADAQIDPSGVMYAAHIESGKVMVYDTKNRTRLADIKVGTQPWSAFVDVLGDSLASYMVPNFADKTLSMIDAQRHELMGLSQGGDAEVYGINYSPLTPDLAFVLNRVEERISVVDALDGTVLSHVNVGGTTETATTTPDGKYVLLPISSTGELAVFDVASQTVIKRFEDVGSYPWSVGMARGQNYCH